MYTPRYNKRSSDDRAGRKFGGRSSPSWKQKPYDRDAARSSESYSAVCSTCGKDCRVPFRPNGKKPVLCTDCFKKDGARTNERSYAPRSFSSAPSNERAIQEQLRAINTKLDAILKAIGSSETEE